MKQITKEQYDAAALEYYAELASLKMRDDRKHEHIFRGYPELFDKKGKEKTYEFMNKDTIG